MVILSERSVWSCAVCVYRPDPEQAGLATGGVLPRHEPDPCRKLPALLKMARITDGRHEGRGRQRPNTWDSPQALTHWMRRTDGLNLLVIVGQALFEGAKLVVELPKELGA